MVDAFCSVYTKDFRFTPKEDEPEKATPCILSDPTENFLPEKDSKVIYNPQRDDEVIKELTTKRYQTIYQISYKHPAKKISKSSDPFSDEFMNYFNREYDAKTQAVLRPPETSKRINGYTRFDFYYTGRTTYQEEISMEAYKAFKKDFDAGISRLFGKRQKTQEVKEPEEQPRLEQREVVEKVEAEPSEKEEQNEEGPNSE